MKLSAKKSITYSIEKDFVNDLRDSALQTFMEDGLPIRFSTEVAAGKNIADLAFLIGEPPQSSSSLWFFSAKECVVLATLRKHGATRIDLLEKRCQVPPEGLRNGELRRLIDREIVTLGPGGRISLAQSQWPIKVVAIEAKLTRWNVALSQAERYLQYADSSFVAIPWEHSKNALVNRRLFTDAGVGLILFDGYKLEIAIDSCVHSQHNWRREFVVSRLAVAGQNWNLEESCLSNSSMNSQRIYQQKLR